MIRIGYRPAPKWSEEVLEAERQRAIAAFIAQRGREGTVIYEKTFRRLHPLVTRLFAATDDLLDFRPSLLSSEPDLIDASRFLAGPPISQDDLDTLAGAHIKGKKDLDPTLVERVVLVIQTAWDPIRFPWVKGRRRPTPSERRAAIDWTCGVWAVEVVRTQRRTESSRRQEARVTEVLRQAGVMEADKRKTILSLDDLPRHTFRTETLLGGIKCDVPVRLADGRILALECKVSNSATNSVKRLIREVGGKAKTWQARYGEQVITAAVLSGVYKLSNLVEAQDSFGVVIFWEHDLEPLREFIGGTTGRH